MSSEQSILVVAGEESGERLAAELVAKLKAGNQPLSFWGVGGERMRAVGVDLVATTDLTAVSGFLEVVKRYRALRRLLNAIARRAHRDRPALAVLVDYPGFNLRLAARLAALDIPIVYYVAPQTWAWKEGRVRHLRRHVSTLIVVFPFEEEYFNRHGVAARYFGNPHAVQLRGSRRDGTSTESSDPRPVIAYLPGSREHEVRRHLPLVLGVVERLGPSYRHIVARARTIDPERLSALSDHPLISVVDGSDVALSMARAAVVKAGTSTLDAALFNVPFATIYKTSWLSYWISRVLIRIPWVAMPNILLQKRIVPELLQNECTPDAVAAVVRELADDGPARVAMVEDLRVLRDQLGAEDAVGNAAAYITEEFLIQR